MLKNHWYIVACSVLVSAVAKSFPSLYIWIPFVLWLAFLYISKKTNLIIIVTSLFTLVFFYFYLPPASMSSSHFIQPENKDIPVHMGKVISPVTKTETRIQFLLKDKETKERILVFHFIDKEDELSGLDKLKHGAFCKIEGVLMVPEGARNPYQFDYRDYLYKQGISYQLNIESLNDLSCRNQSYLEYLYTFRYQLIENITEKLQLETASWMQALVLGEDELLDDEIIDVFRRWGLSHILAISGLHIGIIVGLLYMTLVRLRLMTKENAQSLIIFFLPVYAVLAGGQPSVWRASLMVLAVILLNKMKIKLSYTDIISIIFIFLIVLNKYIIYHIGFQFSFAVTFGLILSADWLKQSRTNTESLLKISFISQMMILPLQVNYFQLFQPLSIWLNVIIVPYFSLFVIPLMFVFLLLLYVPIAFIPFIEKYFLMIHHMVIKLINFVDMYANYPIFFGDIPIPLILIYYILLFIFMKYLEKEDKVKSLKYASILISFLLFLSARPYFSPVGTVTMLDIGQGDAYIIELPYRKGVFIIDAGASFSFPEFIPTDKVYKQIIRPYLYGRGITKIDVIFLSHNDADHTGSIPFLIQEMDVGEIIISPFHELTEKEIQLWKEAKIKVNFAQFNEVLTRKDHQFQVLSPKEDLQSDNENSLILYTKIGGKSWLFTGDAGKETELEMLKNYPNLMIDVLKVGHHGSNTSTDKKFIEETRPAYALISAGVNNRYGHPAEDVIGTLNDAGVIIYRTDIAGAVQYKFTDETGAFRTFLSN